MKRFYTQMTCDVTISYTPAFSDYLTLSVFPKEEVFYLGIKNTVCSRLVRIFNLFIVFSEILGIAGVVRERGRVSSSFC